MLKFLGITISALVAVTAFGPLTTPPAQAASYDRNFGTRGSALIKPPVRRTLAQPSCAAGRGAYFVAAKAFPSRAGIFDPIGTVITKLRASGKADRRFGRAGRINLSGRDEIHEMIPAERGSLVLLQRRINKISGSYVSRGWRILKIDRSGQRDRQFGDRGSIDLKVSTELHPSQLKLRRLDDGHLAVIVSTNEARELMLFTRSGAPASNFGDQGSLTGSITFQSVASNTAQGIWVAGNSDVGPVVQRLTTKGSVAASFDVPAAPPAMFDPNTAPLVQGTPVSLTVRGDKSVLVVIKQSMPSRYDSGVFWAVAIKSDGQVNQSWGDAGFRYLSDYASENTSATLAESLHAGRILIATDPISTSRTTRTNIEVVDRLGRDSQTFTLRSRGDTPPDFNVDEAGRYLVSCGMHDKSVRVKRTRL